MPRMIALFCSITGGNDWWMYAELLRGIYFGEVYLDCFCKPAVSKFLRISACGACPGMLRYFVLFAFYVGLSLVGVLNVVWP